MVPILKSYLKRLTNLSSRNKSLLLLKDSFEQFIDIAQFDFVKSKKSYEIVNQLIADKKSIYLCDEIDPRDEKVNELSKRLKRIARTEKFIKQERGSEDLYIGYPFIRGKLLDGTLVRCPLLFFPVTLSIEKQKWQVLRRENEPISLNRSFLLAYSYFNNTNISDDFLEKTFEDFPKESLPFRTELYNFLKDSPVVLNFNQELFTDSLVHFEKLLKSDLDLVEKNGELKLQQQAVLGIFPQAGSFLVPDYEFLIEKYNGYKIQNNDEDNSELNKKGLAEIFETKANQIDFNSIKEEKIMASFPMDASQELAIKKINAGQSMVIQGPPGTGKSQLICNLIADFAAAGKKVLVVCQKRAALDVVHHRLNTIGFQHFVALIHDFKNDRKQLFNQISDQIGLVDEYKKKNLSLDALWLEQDFNQTSREIDRIIKELDGFKLALFDIDECGVSIKNLYLSSNPNDPFIHLNEKYRFFNQKTKEEFASQLKVYSKYASKLERLGQFWKNRVDFKLFKQTDLISLKKILTELPTEIHKIRSYFEENLYVELGWNEIKNLKDEREKLLFVYESIENETDWKLANYFFQLENGDALKNIDDKIEELKSIFSNNGVESFLEQAEFEESSKYVFEAYSAQQNIISATLYSLFSKEKAIMRLLLEKYHLPFNAIGIGILKAKFENRKLLISWLKSNASLFPNFNIDKLRKDELSNFSAHFSALKRAKILLDLISKIKTINFQKLLLENSAQVKNKIQSVLKLLQDFLNYEGLLERYFTNYQIEYLIKNKEYCSKVITDLNDNFDIFYEADQLKAAFSHTEWAVVISLYHKDSEDVNRLFENSINLAWIAHIEEKYPILRSVSSLKMEQLEQELQDKILLKQSLSQQILLIKAREHTYSGLEYNRLRNLTTYRELLHQVTKKKKLWSIRQLLNGFSEEIFDLLPCWLASPETVSAVFPMEPFFDLIIFDVASQCYAESGIPAIFRGKQIVITGDSKQLQPSDLYAVRFEDDTDEQPELEVSSLLDLAIQYLPQTQLNGHYRSQSIDLIDFSNKYFYKNKLQILPHFDHINKFDANIKFVKVDGVFDNNVNMIEAQEVVSLIKKLQTDLPEKSIGIVTFNYKQQNLIQDLLENEPDLKDTASENLFVKNIENVQGDERDIIIFSVGYGPDIKGKVRIQFGSLNQAGGENRLNVVITRARYQIYMVTSIWPNQLHVEDTLNDGPKLLKKYMEYSLAVSEGKFMTHPTKNEDFLFEKSLKNLLQKNDNDLSNELPFADLVKMKNNKYDTLFLTDDNLFFQSLSAKEAHAYWPINFDKKAWKYVKHFSRDYWKNQKGTI